MKKEQALIYGGIALAVILLWYYLRGSNAPMNVISPNAGAGGLPGFQAPGVSQTFGLPQLAPSPALIYGPPPPLPPTPDYQRYNYAPLNIFNMTPEAAAATPGSKSSPTGVAPGAGGSTCCCDCGSSCPDTGCAKFQDGNQGVCVAANPVEQIQGASSQLFPAMQFNISTSVGGNPNFALSQIPQALGSLPSHIGF